MSVRAEPKVVTLLFADLVGFTQSELGGDRRSESFAAPSISSTSSRTGWRVRRCSCSAPRDRSSSTVDRAGAAASAML